MDSRGVVVRGRISKSGVEWRRGRRDKTASLRSLSGAPLAVRLLYNTGSFLRKVLVSVHERKLKVTRELTSLEDLSAKVEQEMVDQYHCWMHLRHALDQHCPVEIITAQPDNSDNFRFSFSHIEKGKKKQVKLTLPVTYQKYYHFNISNVKIGQIFCILYFSILFLKFVCISHAYFKSDYSHFQYRW